MSKIVLVGELNPYGSDPTFALYPEPRGATGDRLCRKIMGLKGWDYLQRFDRVNLCEGKWSVPRARKEAQRLLMGEWETYVLLGKKVQVAFGLVHDPPFSVTCLKGKKVVSIPHPSGLNRAWNRPEAVGLAREVLDRAGVL
jgi:hypothetical protein